MERLTDTDMNGMARSLGRALAYAADLEDVSVGWGRPYGHVYHVEVFENGENTQRAAAATAITKRGCYDAMYSACIALECAANMRTR